MLAVKIAEVGNVAIVFGKSLEKNLAEGPGNIRLPGRLAGRHR